MSLERQVGPQSRPPASVWAEPPVFKPLFEKYQQFCQSDKMPFRAKKLKLAFAWLSQLSSNVCVCVHVSVWLLLLLLSHFISGFAGFCQGLQESVPKI